MALYEGSTAELLQAGARGGQGLAGALRTCAGVHHEGVSYPQSRPARRATGNLDGLTVDCNHHGWSFTHCTPADERLDALSSDGGHGHGHGLGCGQPVGVVVAGGKVADVVDIAEHEGHGAEPAQTAAGRAKVLSVRPLVTLHVQQRVSVIDEASSIGTERHILTLAVTGDEEAVGCRN